MTRTIWVAASVLVLLTGTWGCDMSQESSGELTDADRTAIRELNDTFVEAARNHDVDGMVATFTSDGMMMLANADTATGHQAIRKVLDAFPPVKEINIEIQEIEGSGNIAYVRGIYSMTIAPEGMDPIQDKGKYVEIKHKQPDGSWLTHVDISNSSMPAH